MAMHVLIVRLLSIYMVIECGDVVLRLQYLGNNEIVAYKKVVHIKGHGEPQKNDSKRYIGGEFKHLVLASKLISIIQLTLHHFPVRLYYHLAICISRV